VLSKRADSARYKSRKTSKLGDADIALGKIERNKADIRIRQAEKGLGSLRILAPHDGIIVFERNWRGRVPEHRRDVLARGRRSRRSPI
jgi:hypothetical protein